MRSTWLGSPRFLVIVCIMVAGLLTPGAVRAQAGGFSLEDILSVPYPTDLAAAAATTRCAWVLNDRGVRNVWTAAAPDFTPVRLTGYSEDDGQQISNLCLSPDGRQLVYVRGGSPNRAGEAPNPDSNPHGAEQAIWLIDTNGGQPRRIAAGHAPVISPDGRELLYVNRGQIYLADLTRSETDTQSAAPTPLFRARGRNGNQRFSPDGRRVLFVSNRQDHSFIGVYDRTTSRITWISPGVDRDILPAWSPDGQKIAYIRLPGLRRHERPNLMGGTPFAIRVAEMGTGTARELWHSPGDDGGFAQYYPAHPLRWAGANRLVFYSEHDGWMHIYALPLEGGTPVDLTPGRAEAEQSELSADGRTLYFSGNLQDIERRHLWRVSTAGGPPQAITSGPGIETDPLPLADGTTLLCRRATFDRPPAVTLVGLTDRKTRTVSPATLPAEYPSGRLVSPRTVTFQAADGLTIHGQLFLPPDARDGDDRAALIFMHGGPIRQMLPGYHYSQYYANAYAMNQYLTSRGFVVLAVNYRSGIGYGRDFRRAPNQGPRGASEYQDILAAGIYLRQRPEVNPEKIGLWGGSYGGYLTAMGLARNSDLFAAGVDLHGVHDWAFRATDFSPGGGWGLVGKADLEEAYLSSPVADLTFWSSPILVIHGDDDRNVLFAQSTDLVQRLREKKVHVEVLVFPDEIHGFLRHVSWLRAYRAAADFFTRFLK